METERILRALEGLDMGVCVADQSMHIVRWNAGAEALLGHRRTQVEGMGCLYLLAEIADDGTAASGREYPHLALAREGKTPGPFELGVRDAAERLRTVRVSPMSLQLEEGEGTLTVYLFDEVEHDLAGPDMMEREDDSESQRVATMRYQALTGREMEVLGLLAQGSTTEEIAVAMSLSLHTVLSHIRNARTKLRAPTKLMAVVRAMRQGLLPDLEMKSENPINM